MDGEAVAQYIMDYNEARRKIKTVKFAETQMELKGIVLNKISQKKP